MKRILLCALATSQLIFAAASAYGLVPIHSWSKRFGAASSTHNTESGEGIAADGSGNVIMTGYFSGIQNFGGDDLDNGTGWGVLLAKYDPAGTHLWSQNFRGGTGYSVAVDGSDNVIVTGEFFRTTTFGGDSLTSASGSDAFIAKYAPDGTHLWSQRFGPYYNEWGISVATDGSDNVFVLFYGSGPLSEYLIVTKYDPSGTQLWSRSFGGAHIGTSIAVDGSGNLIVAGEFLGTVNYGGSDLVSIGAFDIFVAKYDPNGTHLWSQRFGGASADLGPAVAVDALGKIWVTGWFHQTANFGGGNLISAGNADIFLAAYDSDGAHLQSYRYGGVYDDLALSVAVDVSGNLTVTGWFGGSVNFGGGTLVSNGADVFLAQYDATGAHISSQRFGGSSSDIGNATAVDGSGAVFLVGSFYETIDLGGNELVSAGGKDIFLARFVDDTVVPVLISKFEATARDGAVEVRWDVWSDEALERYTLYRSEASSEEVIAEGPFDRNARSYLDTNVEPEMTYGYALVIHGVGGDAVRSQIAMVTTPRVESELGQNFPNPFNPSTTITYTLSERSRVVVSIYDATGRLVVHLDEGVHAAGTDHVEWNGRDASGQPVPSGVYFYKLDGAARPGSKKMVLVK